MGLKIQSYNPLHNAVCLCKKNCHQDENQTSYMSGRSNGTPPWMVDDILLCAFGYVEADDKRIYKLAKFQEEHDPLVMISNFYILQAIANDAMYPRKGRIKANTIEELTDIKELFEGEPQEAIVDTMLKARIALASYTAKIAPLLQRYLEYACYGEASYHAGVNMFTGTDGQRFYGYPSAFRQMEKKFGALTVYQWTYRIFHDYTWSHGYGGKKWAQCTEPLIWRAKGRVESQEFNDAAFCDRVFNLQHNGGTVLNKVQWKNTVTENWHPGITGLLNCHGNGKWQPMLYFTNQTAWNLYSKHQKAVAAATEKAPKWRHKPPSCSFHESHHPSCDSCYNKLGFVE